MKNYKFTISLALILAPLNAFSQVQPNAGTILRETKPALNIPSDSQKGVTVPLDYAAGNAIDATPILVRSITIRGATLFTVETLQALLTNVATGTHTLAELQAAASRITAHYRNAGYFLARAYLPTQKIDGGQVIIAVMEAKLADLKIENISHFSAARAQAIFVGINENFLLHSVKRSVFFVR